MDTIAIIGAGSWGTALGINLCGKGYKIHAWDIDAGLLQDMDAHRENRRYLPGVALPEHFHLEKTQAEALAHAETVIFMVPTRSFRRALTDAAAHLRPHMAIVNVAKGIEQGSLMRMSEIAGEILPPAIMDRYVVLSGPSHAEEVSLHLPTTLVAAAQDRAVAEEVQDLMMSESLRLYTSTDVIGVELGGALKNIIALGAGISDGMGYGDNTKAAMMTRGIAEISRMGVAMGAREDTFYGLAGIGDLIVTCTSMHSRNRRCGILIGEGMSPAQAVEQVGSVVEGVYTVEAAYALAKEMGVSMPITEHIHGIISGSMGVRDAVERLMTRSKKNEREEEYI